MSTPLNKRKLNTRRQRQVVRNWLSSFVTTSAVLVSAVVVSQSAPSAEFLNLNSVGTAVYYEVQIEDESLTLYEDSIKIVAKSSLDEQEKQATIGYNDGVFDALLPNTQYQILVMGNTGFGEYALQKETIKTSNNYGGTLISANFYNGLYQSYDCEVKGLYNDHKNEIMELKVVYSYEVLVEEWQQVVPMEEVIEEEFFTVSIFNLPKINGSLNISLIATLTNEQTVVLDQKSFTAPYVVNAYAYVNQLQGSLEAVIYPDINLINANYFVVLKQNEQVIEQKNVEITLMEEYQEAFYMGEVAFYNIIENNYYTLEFYITFENPLTSETVTTLFYVEYVATFILS